MSLYKEIESYYSRKGISTQQFIRGDNSTEMYLDELTNDFMRLALKDISKLALAMQIIEKLETGLANYENGFKWNHYIEFEPVYILNGNEEKGYTMARQTLKEVNEMKGALK